jgi:hypothetical protein
LNGLYLSSKSARKRGAVLGAIEGGFLRPLGMRGAAIANRHGGKGVMPTSWEVSNQTFRPVHALQFDMVNEWSIGSDLCGRSWKWMTCDCLYWKRLN